jgi:hypothetical protein
MATFILRTAPTRGCILHFKLATWLAAAFTMESFLRRVMGYFWVRARVIILSASGAYCLGIGYPNFRSAKGYYPTITVKGAPTKITLVADVDFQFRVTSLV